MFQGPRSGVSSGDRLVVPMGTKTGAHLRGDQEYARDVWIRLKEAIIFIFKQKPGGLSYEELYRNSYNLVVNKHGKFLYNSVNKLATEVLAPVYQELVSEPDEVFLRSLFRKWEDHKTSTMRVRDILMYMDKNFVPQHNLLSVYECGVSRFNEAIVLKPEISRRITAILLSFLQADRRGESVDRLLFKDVTNMLMELGLGSRDVYSCLFENPFLELSGQFYHEEGQRLVITLDVPSYLRLAEQRFVEEEERVKQMQDASSLPGIFRIVEQYLLEEHVIALRDRTSTGLVALIRQDKLDDLARMYRLFKRVKNGLPAIQEVLGAECLLAGSSIVGDNQLIRDPKMYIGSLLNILRKFRNLLNGPFQKDAKFGLTINSAFELFVNNGNGAMTAEYISLFIDFLLRGQQAEKQFDTFETTLDEIMMLFRYIRDKDVFEGWFTKHLRRRLLQSRTGHEDVERLVLSKLRNECGFQFASRLEGMFNDVRVSNDLTIEFREWKKRREIAKASRIAAGAFSANEPDIVSDSYPSSQNADSDPIRAPSATILSAENSPEQKSRSTEQSKSVKSSSPPRSSTNSRSSTPSQVAHSFSLSSVELTVIVLTTGFWSGITPQQMSLPQSVARPLRLFEAFYSDKHRGRVLNWHMGLGSATLRASFEPHVQNPASESILPRRHELIVSTPQMVLLSLFNGLDLDRVDDSSVFPSILRAQKKGKIAKNRRWLHHSHYLTFHQLVEGSDLSPVEVRKQVCGLCYGKHVLLLRAIESDEGEVDSSLIDSDYVCCSVTNSKEELEGRKEINDADLFCVNEEFSSPYFKVKMGVFGVKETREIEKSETKSRIEDDRKFQLEATIVRVMKSRKTMPLSSLVLESINILAPRFVPTSQTVKRRIEDLINREYLERDKIKRNIICYKA